VTGPTAAWLADGERLHFQHGPIDLIIEATGAPERVDLAYKRAWRRFQTVLTELVDELPRLRTRCPASGLDLKGPVARRMEAAVRPFAAYDVTPMAAVAGAVADEILEAMTDGPALDRAYVNNGGDIALFLSEGGRFEIAMIGDPKTPAGLGGISLRAGDPAGVATSGRPGRSLSLGIADSATALAASAAEADAAATLIANAVDLPSHPGIERVPAREVDPDSDLGDRLVVVDLAPLSPEEIERALAAGVRRAETFLRDRRILAAAVSLEGAIRLIGDGPISPAAAPKKLILEAVSPA
jgi:ApbE superfamily uncharacterized protein (UPF0280 family)